MLKFSSALRGGASGLLLAWLGGVSIMGDDVFSAHRGDVVAIPTAGWRLVSDSVMGGVSTGRMSVVQRAGRDAVCLSGQVRTENNGGFLQLALDLDADLASRAAGYDGIEVEVLGNAESYNVHLRTADLWLPWQSYRAGLVGDGEWRTVRLPFSQFEPYKTRSALRVERLRRLAIVAIGRPFEASICVGGVFLYRTAP